jgi:hypothetical protein
MFDKRALSMIQKCVVERRGFSQELRARVPRQIELKRELLTALGADNGVILI